MEIVRDARKVRFGLLGPRGTFVHVLLSRPIDRKFKRDCMSMCRIRLSSMIALPDDSVLISVIGIRMLVRPQNVQP